VGMSAETNSPVAQNNSARRAYGPIKPGDTVSLDDKQTFYSLTLYNPPTAELPYTFNGCAGGELVILKMAVPSSTSSNMAT
jgi:hypothetical protein